MSSKPGRQSYLAGGQPARGSLQAGCRLGGGVPREALWDGVWSGQGGGSPPGSRSCLQSGDMCLFDRCLLCRPYNVCGQQLGGALGFGSLVKRALQPPRVATSRWRGRVSHCLAAWSRHLLSSDGTPFPAPWSPLCPCPFFLNLPSSETWEVRREGVLCLYPVGWEGDGPAAGLATAWPPH